MHEPMRIVVTGGAGFFGSVLVPMLLAKGHRVHVVDNLMWGGQSLLPLFIHPNFSLAQVDVTEATRLAPELKSADAVVHLAGLVGYPLCKKLPELARRVNVEGTRNVVELSPPDARLIYASTGSNYGEVEGICTEETPLNPLSLYGETKTLGEALCLARPNSVGLRFATAFGLSPRMRLDLMLNDFTWQALHRGYLVVYERHFRRTFIHVTDMARCVNHLLNRWDQLPWNLYNVGHESLNFTKEDIVRLLQARLDFMVHFAEVDADVDRRDYEVHYQRIQEIQFQTRVDIERGLDELIAGLRLLEVNNPYGNV